MKPVPKYTQHLEEIETLVKAKYTAPEIARTLGLAVVKVRYILRRMRLRARFYWNAEKDLRLKTACEAGRSISKLAREFGVGTSTISRKKRQLGIKHIMPPKKPKKEHRTGMKLATQPELALMALLRAKGYLIEVPQVLQTKLTSDDNGGLKFQYPIQRYSCDFVDPKDKVVICVNGDYWHGNPARYPVASLTAAQKHNKLRDSLRMHYLIAQGYRVVEVWQSEINETPGIVMERLCGLLTPHAHVVDDWSSAITRMVRDTKSVLTAIPRDRLERASDSNSSWEGLLRQLRLSRANKEYKTQLQAMGISPRKKLVRARKFTPDVEKLRLLVWEMPATKIGKQYGVCGRAVGKYCALMGIVVPPRGYWACRVAGYSKEASLVRLQKS